MGDDLLRMLFACCDTAIPIESPSALHTLNRAVATAELRGPEAGLALLSELTPPSWLEGSYLWSAVLADLHRRCGHADAAERYRTAAIQCAPSAAVKSLSLGASPGWRHDSGGLAQQIHEGRSSQIRDFARGEIANLRAAPLEEPLLVPKQHAPLESNTDQALTREDESEVGRRVVADEPPAGPELLDCPWHRARAEARATLVRPRWSWLRSILYLLFTEDYLSSHAESAIRKELCDEAKRLARVLAEHEVGQTSGTARQRISPRPPPQ